ncbi:membrane dipeptidase [Trichoderma arundinaceum]|uniref:Dipeptidase n=1 Tax=Trichoderma arundinaceum TaxID=490622 RepID=A0A395NBI0_TRIAR|nr:membrane dipeptidase [Trichoderma arundinaceum]
MLPITAKSYMILPTAGKDGYYEPSYGQPRKPNLKRIAVVVSLALGTIGLLYKPALNHYQRISHHACSQGISFESRAHKILSGTPLIDGHVDFPLVLRGFYGNHLDSDEFSDPFENGTLKGHVDLARLRAGRAGGAFWSVYAPCPENGTDFSDENYAASLQFTLQEIDIMKRLFAAYPDDFAHDIDSSDAISAFRRGKLISPLGIEGLHQIANQAGNLRMFYDLDAALQSHPFRKATPKWGGISPLGRKLVHEMNRIGMIVDLSHVSSAFSICPHPRNVKDHVLQLVKKRNSVVMVNIAPQFISCIDSGNENGVPTDDPENATLAKVADHITYIGNLIGYDYVGIGTDFDGIDSVPKGLEDVTKYPDLIAELLRRGVSDTDAAKVVGGNVIRVWKDVDAVSAELKANGAPILEDEF